MPQSTGRNERPVVNVPAGTGGVKCPVAQCPETTQCVGAFVVCPVHGDVTGAKAHGSKLESFEAFSRALDQYPRPIAYGVDRTIRAENAAVGVKNLVFTYTTLLRTVTLLLLAVCLDREWMPPRVSRAVRRLRMPHLNDWFSVLTTLRRAASRDDTAPACLSPLLEGVSALLGRRIGTQPLHDTLLGFRNDFDGHGASWSEAECARRLDEALTWLADALTCFEALTHVTILRRQGDQYVALTGRSEGQPTTAPDTLSARPTVFAMFAAKHAVPVDPLMLVTSAPDAGSDQLLLSCDGHAHDWATYMGDTQRVRLPASRAPVRDWLDRAGVDCVADRATVRPWTLTAHARHHTLDVLEAARGTRWWPQLQVERSEEADRLPVEATGHHAARRVGAPRRRTPGVGGVGENHRGRRPATADHRRSVRDRLAPGSRVAVRRGRPSDDHPGWRPSAAATGARRARRAR